MMRCVCLYCHVPFFQIFFLLFFSRGQSDNFGIETTDLGDLTKVRISHDNKGFTPGWFLDKVIVESEKTHQKW